MADVNLTVGVNANEAKEGFKEVEKQAEATSKKLRTLSTGGGGSPYNAVDAARARTAANMPASFAPASYPPPQGASHPMWGKNLTGAPASEGGGGLGMMGAVGAGLIGWGVVEGIGRFLNSVNDSKDAIGELHRKYEQFQQSLTQDLHFASVAELPGIISKAAAEMPKLTEQMSALTHRSKKLWDSDSLYGIIKNKVFGNKEDEEKELILQKEAALRKHISDSMVKEAQAGKTAAGIASLRRAGLNDEADEAQRLVDLEEEHKKIREQGLFASGNEGIKAQQELLDQATQRSLDDAAAKKQKRSDESWRKQEEIQNKEFKKFQSEEAKKAADKKRSDSEAQRSAEELSKATEHRLDAEEKLRLSKLSPEELRADREKNLKAEKEAYAKMAPGLAKEKLGAQIAADEMELGREGKKPASRDVMPSIIASSKAQLGLGGGTLSFGSSDPQRQTADMIRQIRDAVTGYKSPATMTQPLRHKP